MTEIPYLLESLGITLSTSVQNHFNDAIMNQFIQSQVKMLMVSYQQHPILFLLLHKVTLIMNIKPLLQNEISQIRI